jgi:magnesium-dependent phosphatase 1
MYQLHAKPSIPEEGDLIPTNMRGVVGMKVPNNGPTVKLFSGARKALYELVTDPMYAGIILAAASSSEEPSYSHACLENIEILPGLTLRQIITHDQIGRTGQLSPNKKSHFRLLQEESGIQFEEMLFFDDCNWGDHCATVTREFGVVSYRTPSGLQYSEFQEGTSLHACYMQLRTDMDTGASPVRLRECVSPGPITCICT